MSCFFFKQVPADVTKFSVKQRDAGRLIGRQGMVVKEVQKLSNAKVIINTKYGRCQVRQTSIPGHFIFIFLSSKSNLLFYDCKC